MTDNMEPAPKLSLKETSLKVTNNLPEKSHSEEGLDKTRSSRETNLLNKTIGRWQNNKEAGMTKEQVAELRKQQMLTRILQDKVTELDSKLEEANSAIKSCAQKTADLAENEAKDTSDLFEAINNVNTTMSKKIAQQRVEIQKLTGDTPIPINYDPFNYGDAFHGDVIDFEARQRILEVKETMKTIMSVIKDMKDHTGFSPYTDLGYKVVRLDRLIHDADRLITERDKDVVVVQQSPGHRGPGSSTTRLPRAEMFQTPPSQYGITDAIQQTMYRLELELAGIREAMGGMDMKTANTTINELKTNMATLKENAVDQNMARKIVKEMTGEATFAGRGTDGHNDYVFPRGSRRNSIAPTDFTEDFARVNRSVNSLNKRLKALEATNVFESPSQHRRKLSKQVGITPEEQHPHGFRSISRPTNSNPEMAAEYTHQMPHHPGFGSRLGYPLAYAAYTPPPRLRYVMNKGYEINVNSDVVGVYHVARGQLPAVGVSSGWRTREEPLPRIAPQRHVNTEDQFIRGKDGKLYIADARQLTQPHSSSDTYHRDMLKKKKGQQLNPTMTFTIPTDQRDYISHEGLHIPTLMTTEPTPAPSVFDDSRQNDFDDRRHSTDEAATLIQAGMRGMLARKSIKKEKIKKDKAAAKIPTLMTTEPTPDPSVFDDSSRQNDFDDRRHSIDEAATLIQAGMRGMLARKSIKKEKIKKDKAAAKIQAGYRGMKTRRETSPETKADMKPEVLKYVKPQFDDRRHSTDEAATLIQAGMRGMLARKSIKKEKIKKDNAAAKIQAGYRGMKTRRETSPETKTDMKPEVKPQETAEEEIDIDLTDPEVEKTALMMQKRFFGKKK